MFPLKKQFIYSVSSDTKNHSFKDIAEIPIGDTHPGSFGYVRKNHIHEGIDIYCEFGDEVFSIEEGIIEKIIPFTGSIAGSPWWNNTYSILVRHKHCYINYGEIIPCDDLFTGEYIREGRILGYITPVLKTNKGRPMNMLHLEAYSLKSSISAIPIKSWDLDMQKPDYLLNPSALLSIYINNYLLSSKKTI